MVFFVQSRVYRPRPAAKFHAYIRTHISHSRFKYHPPSSEVAYVIAPIPPTHPIEYIGRNLPHPPLASMFTFLSVSSPLASGYTLHPCFRSFETISICLSVK